MPPKNSFDYLKVDYDFPTFASLSSVTQILHILSNNLQSIPRRCFPVLKGVLYQPWHFISQYNIQVRIISDHGVNISLSPRTKSVSPARPPSKHVHRTNISNSRPVSVYIRSPPREGQNKSSSSFTAEGEVRVAGECSDPVSPPRGFAGPALFVISAKIYPMPIFSRSSDPGKPGVVIWKKPSKLITNLCSKPFVLDLYVDTI